MAQVKFDIMELVSIMKGEGFSTQEAKENILNTFIDIFDSREFRSVIESRAKELADTAVKKAMDNALVTKTKHTYNKPDTTTIEGWASEYLHTAVKQHFTGGGHEYDRVLRGLMHEEISRYNARWGKTLEDAKPFIEEQVKAMIPQYVTENYQTRVADQFDKTKLEPMVMEMVQKAIGHMFMSGAITVNLPKEGN